MHDVIEAVIPELLLSGNLDCIICARAENHDQRFQAISLFKENMVVAFADGHRFSEFETVSLVELTEEPYLDRLHCEFRDDFLSVTKASGLELNVAIRSEREDWILELVQDGLGVSVLPTSSIVLNTVMHRPVNELGDMRKLELVMTDNASASPIITAFSDAAKGFNWK